jgi:hypothetical protein
VAAAFACAAWTVTVVAGKVQRGDILVLVDDEAAVPVAKFGGDVAAEARRSLRLSGQAAFMGWSVPLSITFSNWSLAVGP